MFKWVKKLFTLVKQPDLYDTLEKGMKEEIHFDFEVIDVMDEGTIIYLPMLKQPPNEEGYQTGTCLYIWKKENGLVGARVME